MRYYFVQYWEKAEFPFHVVPKLAALRIAGGTIKVLYTLHVLFLLSVVKIMEHGSLISLGHQGYGCPGLSVTASAITTAEVSRVDASCSTFILVHSSLAMLTIGEVLI